MKLHLLLSIFLFIFFSKAFSQVPELAWAHSYGNELNDASWDIAVDFEGNSFTTGSFNGTLNFGNTALISNGNLDMYIVKHNNNGEVEWARSFGGVLDDIGYGVTVDDDGNCYITGQYRINMAVDDIVYVSNEKSLDVFVIKLDSEGNVLWSNVFGGTSTDIGNDILVDTDGNVFVTGAFIGEMTIADDLLSWNGNSDVFLVKINSDGSLAWGRAFGGTLADYGRGVDVDSDGNIYITGSANGSIMIGDLNIQNSGAYYCFLVKYNSNGTAIWAKNFTGTQSNYGYEIVVDDEGNSFVVGTFLQSMLIDGSNLAGNGSLYNDGFLIKTDADGITQWAQNIGGSGTDDAYDVTLDGLGNSYVIGVYFANFNIGSTSLFVQGESDAYVACFSPNGSPLWADGIGGSGTTTAYGISAHSNGNVYVTGFLSGDIVIEGTNLSSYGGNDFYIVKYGIALTTNIEVISDLNNSFFIAYPNPSKEFTFIELNAETAILELINAEGKICFSQKINAGHNAISLNHVEKGLYLLKVSNSSKIQVQRMLLN